MKNLQIEDTYYTIRARKGIYISLECGSHREVWVKDDSGISSIIMTIEGVIYKFVSSHYENTDF